MITITDQSQYRCVQCVHVYLCITDLKDITYAIVIVSGIIHVVIVTDSHSLLFNSVNPEMQVEKSSVCVVVCSVRCCI